MGVSKFEKYLIEKQSEIHKQMEYYLGLISIQENDENTKNYLIVKYQFDLLTDIIDEYIKEKKELKK